MTRKLLYKEVKTDLEKLLLKYQFDIDSDIAAEQYDWGFEYQQEVIQRKFLLRAMRATIFLAKIGYSGKAISF